MISELNSIHKEGRHQDLKNSPKLMTFEKFYFRQILNSLSDGAVCSKSDGRMVLVNPAMTSLFGYQEKELIGEKITALVCIGEAPEHCNKVNSLFSNTGRNPFELFFRRKDGSIFPGEIVTSVIRDLNGKEICVLRVIRDTTRRQTLKKDLHQLESTFNTVADFHRSWVIWILLNGDYRYVSPSCEKITGYTVKQFMENPSLFRELIVPEDRKDWDVFREDVKDAPHHDRIQFRIIRKDGERRWLENCWKLVRGADGKMLGYRSSNRDITEWKKCEIELCETYSENTNELTRPHVEKRSLHEVEELSTKHPDIIGNSNSLQYVLFKIEQLEKTDTTVLLLGETGTGKELFANAIHRTSQRSSKPLLKVNCAALSENLIESELFGHERGAFTNAHMRQIGRFEAADKATIFLDEIGELSLNMQAKLLRVLQEGEFQRLGSFKTIKVDIRVIAATNKELEEEVQQGRFRQDLWYRLNVFPITAPPLRERIEDVPQLAFHFLEKFAKKQNKDIAGIPPSVIDDLKVYSWPGNVRELKNVMERAVISSSTSSLSLDEEFLVPSAVEEGAFKSMVEMERQYILKVLKETNWKVSGKDSAAEILKLPRSTLRARMEKYNIKKP